MILYKYLDSDRINVLENGCIRFTQPADFNDPFEFKPVVSSLASKEEMDDIVDREIKGIIESELAKLPSNFRKALTEKQLESLTRKFYNENWPQIEKMFEEFGNSASAIFNNKSNELIGVLSLTEKYDNLLMWSHYAKSHTGFCIGFDSSANFFNRKRSEKDEFYHLRKVTYTDERPIKRLTQLSGTDLLLIKSDSWCYEQEWRMCAVLGDSNYVIEKSPYPIHLFEFPKSIVKEVIVGANMKSDDMAKLVETVREDDSYKNVAVKQAVVSRDKFELEFYEL